MTAFEIVVIGASLGGLHALETAPGGRCQPTSRSRSPSCSTATRLRRPAACRPCKGTARLPVGEPRTRRPSGPGGSTWPRADYHLLVEGDRFALSTEGPVCFARPSIDVLFESAADAYGGPDGRRDADRRRAGRGAGRGADRRRGGLVVVQEPGHGRGPVPARRRHRGLRRGPGPAAVGDRSASWRTLSAGTRGEDHAARERVDILIVDDRPENLLALEAVLAEPGPEPGQGLLRRRGPEVPAPAGLRRDPARRPDAGHGRVRDGRSDPPASPVAAHADHLPDGLPRQRRRRSFEGYSIGAVDFLFKPIVPEILQAKVAVFVDLFEKTEQVKRQAERLRDGREARARARAGRGAAALGGRSPAARRWSTSGGSHGRWRTGRRPRSHRRRARASAEPSSERARRRPRPPAGPRASSWPT